MQQADPLKKEAQRLDGEARSAAQKLSSYQEGPTRRVWMSVEAYRDRLAAGELRRLGDC